MSVLGKVAGFLGNYGERPASERIALVQKATAIKAAQDEMELRRHAEERAQAAALDTHQQSQLALREATKKSQLDDLTQRAGLLERGAPDAQGMPTLSNQYTPLPDGQAGPVDMPAPAQVEGVGQVSPVDIFRQRVNAAKDEAAAKGMETTATNTFNLPENLARRAHLPAGPTDARAAHLAAAFAQEDGANARASMEHSPMKDASDPRAIQVMYNPNTGQPVALVNKVTGVVSPLNGTEGMAGSRAPALPQGGRENLALKASALDQMDKILPAMMSAQSSMGPAWGRIRSVQVGKLGGWGATPEEQRASILMQNLLRDRSFAQGGKQLTGIEREMFERTLPQDSDTVEQAIIKLQEGKRVLQTSLSKDILSIPEMQRGQVDSSFYKAAGMQAPGVGGQHGAGGEQHTIGEVKHFPNGKVGVWDGHGWKEQG